MYIRRQGIKKVGEYIVIEMIRGKNPPAKLGMTVTRRYGKAHERNLFKRKVREAFRLLCHHFPSNIELNIRPRSLSHHASVDDIKNEMMEMLAHEKVV